MRHAAAWLVAWHVFTWQLLCITVEYSPCIRGFWVQVFKGNCSRQPVSPEMCSERDSPLEPFVLLAPGQPELARLICGAHLGPPVLTRKQKRPRVNSLVCDRVAAFSVAGPPEVLSRMSRPVTQAAERERELARACSQRLKQAAPSLPGESVSRGFADRGALEGYPSHYTSLVSLSIFRFESKLQGEPWLTAVVLLSHVSHDAWCFLCKCTFTPHSNP